MFQTRERSLDAHYLFLEGQWSSGCRNGAELWRRLQAQGFRGSLRSVGEWTTRRRRSEAVSKQQLQRVPSARTIARLMTIRRDCMTKADTVVIAAVEAGVPSLVEARTLIDQFHDMIRKKDEANASERCNRELADCVRSSPEQSGEPPLREAPAGCSPVRKVNDEFGLALLRDCLGDPLGGFSGGVVAELVANVAAHDPVVEAIVRNNMNSGCCHRLNSRRRVTVGTGSATVP
jgi:hypothetical protein